MPQASLSFVSASFRQLDRANVTQLWHRWHWTLWTCLQRRTWREFFVCGETGKRNRM